MPKETPMKSYHLNVGQSYAYWKLFVCAREMTFFSKLWKWIKKIPAAAAVVGQRTWEHIHAIITLPLQYKNTSNTCIITLTQRGSFPVRDVWVTTYLWLRCGRCTFHFQWLWFPCCRPAPGSVSSPWLYVSMNSSQSARQPNPLREELSSTPVLHFILKHNYAFLNAQMYV